MLWVISELRFSTKESDEIASFVIEDFYAACGNLSWTSWSTPAGLNLSESRARGYVATWKLCLTLVLDNLKLT